MAFYGDRLGLERTYANDWFVEFRLSDTAYVSIADASRASVPSANGAGVTLGLKVSDLDLIHRWVASRGIENVGFKERFGSRVFDVHDPEGNRIEFWTSPA